MTETIYAKTLNEIYPKAITKIEEYCQYCLRCLHRVGKHTRPTDFTYLTFKRDNGTIAEAIVYPATAINQTLQTIENPLFFYGFKADYDFKDLNKPIRITFSNNYEELIK